MPDTGVSLRLAANQITTQTEQHTVRFDPPCVGGIIPLPDIVHIQLEWAFECEVDHSEDFRIVGRTWTGAAGMASRLQRRLCIRLCAQNLACWMQRNDPGT